MFIKTDYV